MFEGLKAGNAVLDAIHKVRVWRVGLMGQEMPLEKVEMLMLETAEAQETADVCFPSTKS